MATITNPTDDTITIVCTAEELTELGLLSEVFPVLTTRMQHVLTEAVHAGRDQDAQQYLGAFRQADKAQRVAMLAALAALIGS